MKLKELRQSRKLTQKAIASILNIDQSTWSLYENHKREPDIEMLIKIADFFQCSIDCLVGREIE